MNADDFVIFVSEKIRLDVSFEAFDKPYFPGKINKNKIVCRPLAYYYE